MTDEGGVTRSGSSSTRFLEMARQIDEHAQPMQAGRGPVRLPSWADFFSSDDALTVFVHLGAALADAPSVLVFALHHAGPRTVNVVLPGSSAFDPIRKATAARAIYLLDTQVWSHTSGSVDRVRLPSDAEVLQGLRSSSTRHRSAVVGEGVPWIDALAGWAELAGLHADRGRGKWYLRGGLMMQVSSLADGWRLQVGAKQASAEPDVFAWSPNEQPTADEWGRVARRILVDSRSAWFAARPLTYAEHDLQTSITRGLIDLGWTPQVPMLREYPATRPTGGTGYIDFLGLDAARTLRIVETKLGTSDRMLVLQGLDYWMWVRANGDLVATDLGATFDTIAVDYVIGSRPGTPGTEVLNQYQPSVLRRLVPQVLWEVHALPVLPEDVEPVRSFGRRQLP